MGRAIIASPVTRSRLPLIQTSILAWPCPVLTASSGAIMPPILDKAVAMPKPVAQHFVGKDSEVYMNSTAQVAYKEKKIAQVAISCWSDVFVRVNKIIPTPANRVPRANDHFRPIMLPTRNLPAILPKMPATLAIRVVRYTTFKGTSTFSPSTLERSPGRNAENS